MTGGDNTELSGREQDIMPVVERPPAGVPTALIVSLAVLAGVVLFFTLDARRAKLSAPVTSAAQIADPAASEPEPLNIPPALVSAPTPAAASYPPTPSLPSAPTRLQPAAPEFAFPRAPSSSTVFLPAPPPVAPPPETRAGSQNNSASAVVFDRGAPVRDTGTPGGNGSAETRATDPRPSETTLGRVRAGRFANRSTTVPQGTLIPAALETGLDTTRPGTARALVQRDIRGFDGSRILIPRGSRLLGEYQADGAAGQNRALILWTRLLRPDGGVIALASPVTDTEGRTGARAHVNTHFLTRFSSAFLQTFLQVGAQLATQRSSNGIVLALPGSFQGVASTVAPATDIKPTLTVRPGTSISVLAARDLDFTDVEQQP